MPTLYTTIGPWTFPTFNLFITLAVLVGAGIGLRYIRHSPLPAVEDPRRVGEAAARVGVRVGAVVDVYLGGLVGAVAGGRLFHALLNWDYFADAVSEITVISLGGLDWHGAVLGGLVGLFLAHRIKKGLARMGLSPTNPYRSVDLLDALTPALPLGGLAGWWGCLAASCGSGAEVDNLSHYPVFAVAETADVYGIVVPRYNTQLFGLMLSAVMLLFVALLFWRGWLRDRRFGMTLAVLSAGMFVIGFFRGDHAPMLLGLRADQVLDALFTSVAVTVFSRQSLAASRSDIPG